MSSFCYFLNEKDIVTENNIRCNPLEICQLFQNCKMGEQYKVEFLAMFRNEILYEL